MRPLYLTLLAACFALTNLRAEDLKVAEEHRSAGIVALQESQNTPRQVVSAARHFAKAAAIFEKLGDTDGAVEMNSFLYWCKKKMTLDDIEAFTKNGEAVVTERLKAVETQKVEKTDAQTWYDRAEAFAKAKPDEHLLIAIRFFEVADRFKGTDISLKAQGRSLDEQQLASAAPKKVEPPAAAPARPAAEPAVKAAIPDAAKIKDAEKTIKDIFKDEFAKRSADDKKALGQKLLQQASETKDDPVSRYVLLKESAAAASAGADAETALKALDALGQNYELDALALKADALGKILPTTADAAKALARVYLKVIDDDVAADNYDAAVKLATAADTVARKAQDMPLVTQLQARGKEVRALQTDFAKVKAAQATLKDKPDDPAANLAVGKFLCFTKGDWAKGLPLLAKGSDVTLKSIAQRDAQEHKDLESIIALADMWWDFGEKATGATKSASHGRAIFLYRRSSTQVSGLLKTRLNNRVVAFETARRGGTPASVYKTASNGTGILIGGDELNVTKEFCLEFWFKTKASRGVLMTKRQIESDKSFSPRLHDGIVYFTTDGPWYLAEDKTKKPYNDGEWHHLAMAKSGTTIVGFIDGKKHGTFQTQEILNSSSNWTLGFHGEWNRSGMLHGSFDCEFCCIRLSAISRYTEEFVPTKAYIEDIDTLLFK